MDVTYNVDRQNMPGYYLKSNPIADENRMNYNSHTGVVPDSSYPNGYYHDQPQPAQQNQGHSHSHGGLHIPYPPIEVRRPNKIYACMLQRAYAGRVSEFTAISQYVYHSFMLKNCYPEAAHILHEISIQEMHHLDMLAECIIKLGGDPILGAPSSNGKGMTCWCSDIVDYSKALPVMLLKDIKDEYAAIAEYRRIISCINDECIIALLERIILDEQEHIRQLSALLEQYWGAKE